MKLNEIILELQKLENEHGNVEIEVCSEFNPSIKKAEIKKIFFHEDLEKIRIEI